MFVNVVSTLGGRSFSAMAPKLWTVPPSLSLKLISTLLLFHHYIDPLHVGLFIIFMLCCCTSCCAVLLRVCSLICSATLSVRKACIIIFSNVSYRWRWGARCWSPAPGRCGTPSRTRPRGTRTHHRPPSAPPGACGDVAIALAWRHREITVTSGWHCDIIMTPRWQHSDITVTSPWHQLDIAGTLPGHPREITVTTPGHYK